MDLTYSPEQVMLRDNVFRFLEERYTPERRLAAIASPVGHDPQIWREFAELGWLGLPFSEADGGFDGGAVETAILMEGFGRSLAIEPWLPAVLLAGRLVARFANESVKGELLGSLIAGDGYPALAHIEREAGYDLMSVATEARPAPAGFVLNGRKTHVLGAAGAAQLLVTARLPGPASEAPRIGVFRVAGNAPGVTLKTYRLFDQSRAAHVVLDSVAIGKADLIAEDLPRDGLEEIFDVATAALAAEAVGAMDALLAATIRYTKERSQFGKLLAQFQALRHRMAEMANRCETARASALLATLSLTGPRDFRVRSVSGAKMKIGRESRLVAQEAIQLHGAMGISEEMPIGQWFKRLFVIENSFGSTAYHAQRYRRTMTASPLNASSLLVAAEG